MDATGLTVCMIVRDERGNLEELLPGIAAEVDEVLVVDTGSRDGSAEVARAWGARVLDHAWDDDFARARNAGLAQVRTSHAMWLDADDRVSAGDLAKVRDAIRSRPDRALSLLLVNESADPAAVTSCWQLRAFPARAEHRFHGRVHEQIHEALARTGTPVERLDATIRHLGYARPDEVLRKARRNLALLRRELASGGADDVNVLYHLMRAATRCGEPEEAMRAARRIWDSPPRGVPAEIVQSAGVTLGRLLFQRGATDEAIATLRDAVGRAPEDPLARFFLADLLRRTGDLHGAARELGAARACPVRFDALPVPVAGLRRAIRNTLGETLERLGRHVEACAAYREALREAPQDAALGRALARACIAAEELDEAERILDGVPEQDGDVVDMLRLRAALAFARGRDSEAALLFARVEERAPRDGSAPLHLGHLALRAARAPDAERHYLRALGRQDTPEARVGMAAAQLEQGKLSECLDHLVMAVEACPNRPLPPGTEAVSGEALLRLGRPAEARDAFERHLRRQGPDARILARLADCYRELGAPQAARRGYEEALRLAPGLAEAARGLGALAGSTAPEPG
jgi:tetratricopeptide (TPR) repeat protein